MQGRIVANVAIALAALGIAACQNTKAIEKDVADLKSQFSQLQTQLQATRRTAEQANTAAMAASQTATGARDSANQALAAVSTTDEKIDRALRTAVAK